MGLGDGDALGDGLAPGLDPGEGEGEGFGLEPGTGVGLALVRPSDGVAILSIVLETHPEARRLRLNSTDQLLVISNLNRRLKSNI